MGAVRGSGGGVVATPGRPAPVGPTPVQVTDPGAAPQGANRIPTWLGRGRSASASFALH